MSPDPFVLVPSRMASQVQTWGANWGWLDLKFDKTENLIAVVGFSDKEATRLAYAELSDRGHYLRSYEKRGMAGVWYRAAPIVHDMHYHAALRGLQIKTDALHEAVVQGWRQPPPEDPWLTLMFTVGDAEARWSAWWVTRDAAQPCRFDIVRDVDPFAYLADAWPIDELSETRVVLVGVGSIGSSAAEVLAAGGVGKLALVDPDRLKQHNLPRHRLGERDLGRHKVTAMASALNDRFPATEVQPLVADVARDADLCRPLFERTDVVLCATDGVQSRRVVNHLARRAGVPLVLAAVLEDGAYGEIIRVRQRTGCLLCLRRGLETDGLFDPEPGLDQDYGTGTPHRPMAAAPPDLRVMGDLAAKVVLSTLLERRGRWTQRPPGDWAIVALQPIPEMPPPFDAERAGHVQWLDLPERRDDCPTCAPP